MMRAIVVSHFFHNCSSLSVKTFPGSPTWAAIAPGRVQSGLRSNIPYTHSAARKKEQPCTARALEDGGFVAWFENAINAESASVCGGQSKVSSGFAASVSGGYENSSASWYSTVGGGNGRSATTWYDWATGEMDKTHQDHDPVIREGE